MILGKVCGAEDPDNNRTIVLQLLANGTSRINADEFSERQIPSLMWTIMEHRSERILRVVVDDEVEYGRFVSLIAETKQHVPDLAVMMLREGAPEDVMRRWCFPAGVDLPPRY